MRQSINLFGVLLAFYLIGRGCHNANQDSTEAAKGSAEACQSAMKK